jgi:hypothetical protein
MLVIGIAVLKARAWSGRHRFLPLLCVTLVLAACVAGGLIWAEQNPSRPFAPGACGPADHSYIRVAEETGGIPFFFQRSEVSKAMEFMAADFGKNRVTLLWATGNLQGAVREFLVPLDSALDQVVFTLSVDNHLSTMDVLRPPGAPITSAVNPQKCKYLLPFQMERSRLLAATSQSRSRVEVILLSLTARRIIFLYLRNLNNCLTNRRVRARNRSLF